jgi:hypothetical protein
MKKIYESTKPISGYFEMLLFLGLILTLTSWWVSAYFGFDFHSLISSQSNDPPSVVPISPENTFGVHTFGDFLLPSEWARLDNPWLNELPPLNPYPPLAMFIFKVFTVFPYKISLILFLGLNLVSLLFPIIHHLRHSKKSGNFSGILLFLMLSTGFISTLDRGNVIGLIVAPTYLFFFFFKNGEYRKANLMLAFIISIKIYPILLLLMYIKPNRIKDAFRVFFYASLFSLVTLIFFSEPVESARMIIHAILTGSVTPKFGTELLNPANISLAASFTQFTSTNFGQFISLPTILTIANTLSVVYAVLLIILIKINPLSFDSKSLLIISSTWMVPQVSMPYVSALLVCVVIMNLDSKIFQDLGNVKNVDKVRGILIYCAILTTLAPIAWPMHSSLGVDYNLMRPVASFFWLFFLIFELYRSLKDSRLSKRKF